MRCGCGVCRAAPPPQRFVEFQGLEAPQGRLAARPQRFVVSPLNKPSLGGGSNVRIFDHFTPRAFSAAPLGKVAMTYSSDEETCGQARACVPAYLWNAHDECCRIGLWVSRREWRLSNIIFLVHMGRGAGCIVG